MTVYCAGCGVIERPDGGYDHGPKCVLFRGAASPPPREPSIPPDGVLHRCYCGVPIWFGRLRDGRPEEYPQPEQCWREPGGTPHKCREVKP